LSDPLRVDGVAGLSIDTHFLAISDLVPHANGEVRFVVPEGNVGNVEGGFLFYELAGLTLLGLHVPLDHVQAFDKHAIPLGVDPDDSAQTALVLSGDHLDLVVFFDAVFAYGDS